MRSSREGGELEDVISCVVDVITSRTTSMEGACP
jgi:hypothetical protein